MKFAQKIAINHRVYLRFPRAPVLQRRTWRTSIFAQYIGLNLSKSSEQYSSIIGNIITQFSQYAQSSRHIFASFVVSFYIHEYYRPARYKWFQMSAGISVLSSHAPNKGAEVLVSFQRFVMFLFPVSSETVFFDNVTRQISHENALLLCLNNLSSSWTKLHWQITT